MPTTSLRASAGRSVRSAPHVTAGRAGPRGAPGSSPSASSQPVVRLQTPRMSSPLAGARAASSKLALSAVSSCQPGRALRAVRWSAGNASRRPRSRLSVAAYSSTSVEERPQDGPLIKMPKNVENIADDPNLANPLVRHQRLSTGWMGVIFEYEGIVVPCTWEAHQEAWLSLAEEEGKQPPLQWALKRAEGMKAEQVISEVFCWSRNPSEVRRIALRKEEIYQGLVADTPPTATPAIVKLLETCLKNEVPVALATSEPEERVLAGLEAAGVRHFFDAVVTAGDCQYSRPDPEPYLYAAQLIQRPPVRCVVVGSSNASIEGSREAGMQSVIAANRTPIYQLTSADLVVRDLSEISFMNLKQLFQTEELTSWNDSEAEPEMEAEVDYSSSTMTSTMTIDMDL